MASMRGRGRGNPSNGPGGATRGGGNGGDGVPRRGSWRGGPPPGVSVPGSRGGSPMPSNGPRVSINDHMNEMRKVNEKGPTGKAFQTDADISSSTAAAPRELKPWVPDAPSETAEKMNGAVGGAGRDSETFGAAAGTPSWDQFETNARLFGTKTNYQEEIYTTKLNKGGADFKKREKEAERLAGEIMGQTASNPHLAEERNQVTDWTAMDEEDKFSGVARNPNAYVPPAARRGGATGNAPARPIPSPSTTPSSAAAATAIRANGATANGSIAATLKPPGPTTAPAPEATTAAVPPQTAHAISDIPDSAGEKMNGTTATVPPQAAEAPAELKAAGTEPPKDDKIGVVDHFRQFMGAEKAKVQAQKQSMAKTERERQLADFKKFQLGFKVPLPMPKDILPILAKDEAKQKEIEAKAQDLAKVAVEAKKAPEGTKPPSSSKYAPEQAAKSRPPASKKIAMSIREIPPFNPAAQKPSALPIPETAGQNIPQATSPTPSNTSQIDAKLNPNANSFVFKPNPSAVAFKPGQSSSGSPAVVPAQVAPAPPTAGPSVPARNLFFGDHPPRKFIGNSTREEFNPWKNAHGHQVPAAATIPLAWPFTGRKYHASFGGPQMPMPMSGFDDDPSSPHGGPPQMMGGMPPNFPVYGYRFQGGLPQMPGQMGSPMFSPPSSYSSLPGGPMHSPPNMSGPQGANGMPLYYQNGMAPNHFIPPQHMQQFNTPQRHGPGPGQGPGGPGMYYQHQMNMQGQVPTPQQTPQIHHSVLQPPSQAQYQPHSSMQSPMQSGGFEGQH